MAENSESNAPETNETPTKASEAKAPKPKSPGLTTAESKTPKSKPAESKTPLSRNMITFIGLLIAGFAFVSGLVLLVAEMVLENRNPYSALITYIGIPAVIATGLGIAGLGMLLTHLKRKRKLPETEVFPVLNFNVTKTRRVTVLLALFGMVFFTISAIATYKAFLFTESTEFCGTTCHGVMGAEYAAYENSPHSRVACVECHIGHGAEWYARSKISGLRQVYRTLMDNYETPIPTPVHNLRPARETCEECHWPTMFHGSVERVQWRFWYDRENTASRYHMLLKVGGANPETGQFEGIHWHTSADELVRYWPADEQRLEIPWIEVQDAEGNLTVYRDENAPEGRPPESEIRTMDCIDCHNRPSHIFPHPRRLINQALVGGRLDRSMRSIKSRADSLLSVWYETYEEADEAIETSIRERYPVEADSPYTQASVDMAIEELQAIYRSTNFPEQGVSWQTYPDHIGHNQFPGCFRCHDDQHESDQGALVSMECDNCHLFVFQGHEEAAYGPTVYSQSPWEHPDGDPETHIDMLCTECHAPGADE